MPKKGNKTKVRRRDHLQPDINGIKTGNKDRENKIKTKPRKIKKIKRKKKHLLQSNQDDVTKTDDKVGIKSEDENMLNFEAHIIHVMPSFDLHVAKSDVIKTEKLSTKQFADEHHKNTHPCPECDTCFSSAAHLKSHFDRHHLQQRPYQCVQCHKKFANSGGLRKHDLFQHQKTPKLKHECTHCARLFFSPIELRNHLRTHTGDRPFACADCDRRFSQRSNLCKHLLQHLGVKPFACARCAKAFAHAKGLQLHMYTHSGGAKALQCDTCAAGFLKRFEMMLHYRIHTGERPFPCDRCEARFLRRHDLTMHRRLHTGDRPYPCSLCTKAFVSAGPRQKHVRRFHKREDVE